MVEVTYSKNIINEVLENLDIVEIISQYLTLKRSGENFKALCPFHSEKTPSFMVSPKKQIFHCFGCHIGGNAYSFIMKMEGYSFPQALKFLADKAGITLPKYIPKEESKKNRLLEINRLATIFYHHNLKTESSKKALTYLRNRKVGEETLNKFKLGYAPSSWNSLFKYLTSKKISPNEIKEAGLIIEKEGKGFYDIFRGRVIFPIFDIQGRTVGFGARVLDNSLPKYINSPETSIYNKSEILYALNFAKEEIRKVGFTIIVEGYMDAIIAHQFGINNTIATLGTSLTLEHAKLIKRYTDKVFIVFDSDSAGINATLRSFDILLENDIQIQVVTLPPNLDPAEFLIQKGRDSLLELLDNAWDILDYRLIAALKKVDLDKAWGKISLINELRSTYERLPHPLQKEEFIRKISEKTKIEERIILMEITSKKRLGFKENEKSILLTQEEKSLEVEKNILKIILENTQILKIISQKIAIEDFEDPDCQAIYSLILRKEEDLDVKKLMEEVSASQRNLLSKLAMEDEVKGGLEEMANNYLKFFYQKRLNKKANEIKEREKRGIIDPQFIKEYYELRKEIEKLEKEE
jgi:DNA primase